MIIKNPYTKRYEAVTRAVSDNGGYCPCAVEKTEETKCPCKNFREQNEEGFCECGRFQKVGASVEAAVKEYIENLRETLISGGIYPVFVKNAITCVAEEMGVDLNAD